MERHITKYLAIGVREILSLHDNVIEKRMFGWLCFMLNDKMCVGNMKEKLMCRVDLQDIDSLLEKNGCSMMDFTGKPMKGFVLVDSTEIESHNDLKFWIDLCVAYNPLAQSSKKKRYHIENSKIFSKDH